MLRHAEHWLRTIGGAGLLVEAFAGGASVALHTLAVGLARRAVLVEADEEVAAFWRTATTRPEAVARAVLTAPRDLDGLTAEARREGGGDVERAARTLIRNRIRYNGTFASRMPPDRNPGGASLRWYPGTIARRLRGLADLRGRIRAVHGDGTEAVRRLGGRPGAAVFADPPYLREARRNGEGRLYRAGYDAHEALFDALARTGGPFLLTIDDEPRTRAWCRRRGFHGVRLDGPSTHPTKTESVELAVTRGRVFPEGGRPRDGWADRSEQTGEAPRGGAPAARR